MNKQVLMSDAKSRLLAKMVRGEVAPPASEAALEPRAAGTPVPLAPSQRQIWLHSQMTPAVPVYNEPITLSYRGALDREVLDRSFSELLRRHEIWRTTFETRDDQVVQIIHELSAIRIPYSDVSLLPAEERENAAIRLATIDAKRPFDLTLGPPLRPHLIKLAHDHYQLHITLHHLIFDGMAVYHVFLNELATIYDAFSKGQPSPLPEPRLQYADYALWQKSRLEDSSAAGQIEYWRHTLADAEPSASQLPSDRPRPAVPSARGETEIFTLPEELLESVKRAAREQGVTIYMLLLATFIALIHRYSGQEDLMLGAVTDGRHRSEFENLIGTFTNTVVLRAQPRGDITFRDLLYQVKDVVLGAMANRDVPFDLLVRELHPKRDASRNPFYQVMFSIGPPPQKDPDCGWQIEQLDIETGASKCDLFFTLDECRGRMIGRFRYSPDLFDSRTMQRMSAHWMRLVQSAVREPSARLRDLSMMDPAEKEALVSEHNNTQREIPDLTIHELIERQVERTPDAVAVEAAGVRLTYRELNERANRLARRLQAAGVTPGALVALCLDRTVDLIVAPLAVLKTGAAYLPLDPAFPRDRLAYLLEDSRAAVFLSSRSVRGQLPPTSAQVLYTDGPDNNSGDNSGNNSGNGADSHAGTSANLAALATPQSLAYVRYTSGSTGHPKGVEILHRSLVNLLLSMQREPGFTSADSLLAITTHSFDISELELCLPLIAGGRLVIAPREDASDSRRLAHALRTSNCTVFQATPATWRGLIDTGWKGQSNLKALCGGEALPRDLAELLLPRVAELWDVYGPTETTVWSAVQRVTSGSGPVPIGHPIDNTQMYLLDRYQNLVPDGIPGELYIGGAGVARGYLRREQLMHRFMSNPFWPGERLYRTGDVTRRLPDGTLEYLGRIDNQVKVRGFRIEPGEIEAVLARHPGVGQCAVLACEFGSADGDKQLVAYFESDAQPAPTPAVLRSALKKHLPEYMVPSMFVHMDKLPLTPNGKIDRKALAALDEIGTDMRTGFVPPADPLEQLLANIWAKILKVNHVGMRDDFFDLGGHSLTAVRLLVEIQKATGKTLPLATLFQASTVESLAAVLREDGWTPQWSSLVPIQPLGTRTPLFLVHGAEGNVLLYRQLAQNLGPDQPVYGLQSRGLSGDGLVHTNIRDMAAEYVKEILAVQPDGPYLLGGYCLGGIIAYEMAQQLTALRKTVEVVVLLDAYNLSMISPSRARLQAPLRFLQNIWFHYANAVSLGAKDSDKFLRQKQNILIARAGIRVRAAYHALLRRLVNNAAPHRYPHLVVKKANDRAAMQYVPVPYEGRIAVIRSKGSFVGLGSPSLAWDRYVANGLEIHELPMYSKAMLIDPFCRVLAQRLTQIIAPKPKD